MVSVGAALFGVLDPIYRATCVTWGGGVIFRTRHVFILALCKIPRRLLLAGNGADRCVRGGDGWKGCRKRERKTNSLPRPWILQSLLKSEANASDSAGEYLTWEIQTKTSEIWILSRRCRTNCTKGGKVVGLVSVLIAASPSIFYLISEFSVLGCNQFCG